MISLIRLAQEKKLPIHQYMDEETLAWIKSNEPNFQGSGIIQPAACDSLNILQSYTPKTEWFVGPQKKDRQVPLKLDTECIPALS
jgi:hypothetical protein